MSFIMLEKSGESTRIDDTINEDVCVACKNGELNLQPHQTKSAFIYLFSWKISDEVKGLRIISNQGTPIHQFILLQLLKISLYQRARATGNKICVGEGFMFIEINKIVSRPALSRRVVWHRQHCLFMLHCVERRTLRNNFKARTLRKSISLRGKCISLRSCCSLIYLSLLCNILTFFLDHMKLCVCWSVKYTAKNTICLHNSVHRDEWNVAEKQKNPLHPSMLKMTRPYSQDKSKAIRPERNSKDNRHHWDKERRPWKDSQ